MQPIAIRVYSERSFIRHRPLTALCHTKQQVRSQKISISNPRKWGCRTLRKKASSQHIYITFPITSVLTAQAQKDLKVTEILILFLKLNIWAFMKSTFCFFSEWTCHLLKFTGHRKYSVPWLRHFWKFSKKCFSGTRRDIIPIMLPLRVWIYN